MATVMWPFTPWSQHHNRTFIFILSYSIVVVFIDCYVMLKGVWSKNKTKKLQLLEVELERKWQCASHGTPRAHFLFFYASSLLMSHWIKPNMHRQLFNSHKYPAVYGFWGYYPYPHWLIKAHSRSLSLTDSQQGRKKNLWSNKRCWFLPMEQTWKLFWFSTFVPIISLVKAGSPANGEEASRQIAGMLHSLQLRKLYLQFWES